MFIHNINPVFFSIGPVSVRYYGLVYFVGFLFAYFFLKYMIKKIKIVNMDSERLDTFMLYLIIGSMVGSRLFEFIFYSPGVFLSDPLEIFRVWNGGLSIHGGLFGAFVVSLIFTKKYKVKFNELADILIIPLMFFLFIGRIANYINGELWGTITSSSFCVDYSQNQYIMNPPSGCRHLYQWYAAFKNLAVGFALIGISRIKNIKSGLVFWWGILLYDVLRFFVDFYRDGDVMGQVLSLVFAVIAAYFIFKINKKSS